MPRIYRILKDVTGTSEETINCIVEKAKDIANNANEPTQGRRASLLQSLHAYFDETQVKARKVLNHVNLYALGVCGPSAYADTKKTSDHPYNQAKGDAVNKLRPILNRIQELTLFQINQTIIVDIINELHAIHLTLNTSINKQNKNALSVDNIEKFYDFLGKTRSHSGGKIGAVINGKHFKMLMQTLAGLFIFARIKERSEKKLNYHLDEKYNIPPHKPQPKQSQIIAALEREEKQRTKRLETSGKNLFALIKEQTRAAETGIDSITAKSEKKFETMLINVFNKKQSKTTKPEKPPTPTYPISPLPNLFAAAEKTKPIDYMDHKHKQIRLLP